MLMFWLESVFLPKSYILMMETKHMLMFWLESVFSPKSYILMAPL